MPAVLINPGSGTYARLLGALSRHLLDYPHLCLVNITRDGSLQIAGPSATGLTDLIEWTRSLRTRTITAERYAHATTTNDVVIRVHTRLGRVDANVWDSGPWAAQLGLERGETRALTLPDLRKLAKATA